ncbi:MAG: FMN-binding glutamate synthase family protein [Zhaonellaceae bacterium]
MSRKNALNQIGKLSLGLATALLGAAGLKKLARKTVKEISTSSIKTIMTDMYDENLWEFVSASTRVGLQNIVETNLRSEQGKVIERPLGSPRKFPSINSLTFNFAQLKSFPTPGDVPIDMSVTIGPEAAKPLHLKTPIIVSGMAYGYALSEAFKIALAKGASAAGTATNTGEGAWLDSERKAADKLILQYNRGSWSKEIHILQQADAIEIQLGQGAIGGVAHFMTSTNLNKKLRKAYGLLPGEHVVVHSRAPEINNPRELYNLVSRLRKITGGVPIGVKIGAGKYLEADLDMAVSSGVDYVAICGAEAATKGSPPILQDDFGLPTVFVLARAGRFWREQGLKGKVSLIAAGKLLTPGDFLKAIALGADAVYVGTMALFATAHTQVLHSIPFEPPTQVAWYNGKSQNKFKIEEGAKYLANYLKSCTLEMTEGIKALGKTSLKEVNMEDLISLDPLITEATGITPGYEPMPY